MAHPTPLYEPYYMAPPLHTEYIFTPTTANDRNFINTLFVSGLPDDVKAREIHNLFRRRPGFESCQLKYTGRGNQVVAFATFVNHQTAMATLHTLNGVKFDPQTGSTLHIELARSNSRRKNKPGSGPYVVIDNRSKAKIGRRESSSDEDSESELLEKSVKGDCGNKEDPAPAPAPAPVKSGETASDAEGVVAHESSEKTTDGSSACSTLFIANLGPNCTEDELKQHLSQYPGFNTLKMRARGGMPVAFADFKEIDQATDVMDALQGSTLPSSDRGGMHIEYARSKMRKS